MRTPCSCCCWARTPPSLDGFAYDSPHGTVEFRGGVAHQRLFMGAAAGVDFDVVATL
ncbi:hypothetical protein [Nocardia stercoris]|uniref:hypothetical protein n=1 Tax=Nocardia stercoris TaxID=2483361 RepID=UPI001319DD2D|nr:hypothetical protein [Nocardia stercoris]